MEDWSLIVGHYLAPAISLGKLLASEGTAQLNTNSALSDGDDNCDPTSLDTLGEEELMAETESDWQDTDSTPSLDTIRSGPPPGALENLFKIDLSDDIDETKTNGRESKTQLYSSNAYIISIILRLVSHMPQLATAEISDIKQITINLASTPKVWDYRFFEKNF